MIENEEKIKVAKNNLKGITIRVKKLILKKKTLDPGIEVNINIFYGWSQLINAYSTILTLGH